MCACLSPDFCMGWGVGCSLCMILSVICVCACVSVYLSVHIAAAAIWLLRKINDNNQYIHTHI